MHHVTNSVCKEFAELLLLPASNSLIHVSLTAFFDVLGRFNPLIGRSQWPRSLRRRSTAARLLRSWVRIPPRACFSVVGVVCCQVEVSATD